MLVLCNGGMKSGSTWLTQIVKESGFFEPVPEQFRNPQWKNPSIDQSKIDVILSDTKLLDNNFLYSKQHWSGRQFDSLLAHKNVKVLNIVRDVRDVLVSRYYHDKRVEEYVGESIDDYYWNHNGKSKLENYLKYQFYWHSPSKPKQPFLAVYEKMIASPAPEIAKIFQFLGIEISESKLNSIVDATSFQNSKSKDKSGFFRKGIRGDWKSHLNNEILDDIHLSSVNLGYFKAFPWYETNW